MDVEDFTFIWKVLSSIRRYLDSIFRSKYQYKMKTCMTFICRLEIGLTMNGKDHHDDRELCLTANSVLN